MCGSSKKSGIQSSTSTPAGWADQGAQEIWSQVRSKFLQAPMTEAYTGQRVAQPGQDFNSAVDALRGMFATPVDTFGKQRSGLDAVMADSGPEKTVQDYMNPYVEGVLNPTLRKIREQGEIARNDINTQAIGSGAFGDSKHGVLEALQRRMESEQVGDATAQGYSGAFDRAQGARDAGLARFMAALSGLGGVQTAEDSRQQGLIKAMMGAGDYQRNLDQAKLDADFGEFMRMQNQPIEQYRALASILSGLPMGQSNVGFNQQSQPNTGGYGMLGSLLGSTGVSNAIGSGLASLFGGGAGLTGASAGGALAGAGAGGLSSILASAGPMLALSDERAKTDIKPVGELLNGLKVYKYRYKDGGPAVIGLMAQEVAAEKPEAVGIMPSGFLGVDYERAVA